MYSNFINKKNQIFLPYVEQCFVNKYQTTPRLNKESSRTHHQNRPNYLLQAWHIVIWNLLLHYHRKYKLNILVWPILVAAKITSCHYGKQPKIKEFVFFFESFMYREAITIVNMHEKAFNKINLRLCELNAMQSSTQHWFKDTFIHSLENNKKQNFQP